MTNLFADRYDIQRELGRGAFGVVYLAHDTRLRHRPVALKILHPVLSSDPGVVRLFQNEAGVLATLQHDHIVTVYDADVWQDRRYIAMTFVDGPSLAQIVHEQGAQPPERVTQWMRQAASALAYAHEHGVLHRDVKSANLLLDTERDRLVMTDFGLARAVEASGGSSYQSNVGVLTGTAAYRAPEVVRTGHTPSSDLYSLGVVAYELLAGRWPFESDDLLSLIAMHASEPPPPLPAGTPPTLEDLVKQLLAKGPEERPATARGVTALLAFENKDQESQSQRPVAQQAAYTVEPAASSMALAKPFPSSPGPSEEPARRKGGIWPLLVLGALVVLASLVFAVNNASERSRADATVVVAVDKSPAAIASETHPTASATAIALLQASTALPATATRATPTRSSTPTSTSTTTSTPTATPSHTPIPTSTPRSDAVVISQTANLRVGPGTGYDRWDSYPRGTEFEIVGKSPAGDWLQVRCSDGKSGWIAADLLQVKIDASQIAVASIPPTPTPAPTEPFVSLPHFDPECGSALKRPTKPVTDQRLYRSFTGYASYSGLQSRSIIICKAFGIDSDGARHEAMTSYNFGDGIAMPTRGRATAYCAFSEVDLAYPTIEFILYLKSMPSDDSDIYNQPTIALADGCRYRIVD